MCNQSSKVLKFRVEVGQTQDENFNKAIGNALRVLLISLTVETDEKWRSKVVMLRLDTQKWNKGGIETSRMDRIIVC